MLMALGSPRKGEQQQGEIVTQQRIRLNVMADYRCILVLVWSYPDRLSLQPRGQMAAKVAHTLPTCLAAIGRPR